MSSLHTAQLQVPQRSLTSIRTPRRLGADEQVDDKALVLPPGGWALFDPFLMLAEDWFSAVGFDFHPHRGIETVTFVLDGQLEHRDNRGGHGVLGPGDAQWMTAGSGIIHSEKALEGKPVHSLQLWVNLPAAEKMTGPGYQDLKGAEMPVRKGPGFQARVFSGRSGEVIGPARNHVPVTMVEVTMDAGARFTQALPAGDSGFVYALAGEGRFGPAELALRAGQVAQLSDSHERDGATELSVVADQPLRLLLFSGRPLREPVVSYGPFVMNTREQIIQAFQDFQAGKFGPVPDRAPGVY
jgi:quercetin 2,3-dioxygenase